MYIQYLSFEFKVGPALIVNAKLTVRSRLKNVKLG
jgi:hypothetical protein